MKNLILSLAILFSTQAVLASAALDVCISRADKHTAFTKDSPMKDCIKFAENADDCVTISTKLTRFTQDHFLNNQCIPKSTSYEECARVANRITTDMPAKEGALKTCETNFPQSK